MSSLTCSLHLKSTRLKLPISELQQVDSKLSFSASNSRRGEMSTAFPDRQLTRTIQCAGICQGSQGPTAQARIRCGSFLWGQRQSHWPPEKILQSLQAGTSSPVTPVARQGLPFWQAGAETTIPIHHPAELRPSCTPVIQSSDLI